MSTIFAGLNTLKRLEIRLAGGPFVHGVPADRHEGLQRVIRARKREENRVQEGGVQACRFARDGRNFSEFAFPFSRHSRIN